MMTTIEFIQRKMENLNNLGLIDKLEIILGSINDWPVETNTLEEFCEKVELFLGKIPTKKNIDLMLKEINLNNNAWEAEALSQLTVLFDFYDDGVSLQDILVRLKNEIM